MYSQPPSTVILRPRKPRRLCGTPSEGSSAHAKSRSAGPRATCLPSSVPLRVGSRVAGRAGLTAADALVRLCTLGLAESGHPLVPATPVACSALSLVARPVTPPPLGVGPLTPLCVHTLKPTLPAPWPVLCQVPIAGRRAWIIVRCVACLLQRATMAPTVAADQPPARQQPPCLLQPLLAATTPCPILLASFLPTSLSCATFLKLPAACGRSVWPGLSATSPSATPSLLGVSSSCFQRLSCNPPLGAVLGAASKQLASPNVAAHGGLRVSGRSCGRVAPHGAAAEPLVTRMPMLPLPAGMLAARP